MADNKRATKRERRDEAKRRRLEELRRRQRQARMRKMAMAGVAGLVIAGIVALVMVLGGGGNPEESNRLAAAAGCDQVENPPIITTQPSHIAPPATATYNTNPPTSGQHYAGAGLGPLTTGIHRAAVQYEGSVHNLEHGHIVIHYKESVGPEIANILAEVVRRDPAWIMLAPNPNLPTTVAFTAWGHLQNCNTPIASGLKAAAEDFVKRFKDKSGVESVQGTPEPGTDTAVPPTTASPTGTSSPSPSPTATGTGT